MGWVELEIDVIGDPKGGTAYAARSGNAHMTPSAIFVLRTSRYGSWPFPIRAYNLSLTGQAWGPWAMGVEQ